MNKEAFKAKLKHFENSGNPTIFYCDKDSTGRTLVNIGYGFLLNPNKIYQPELIWKYFAINDFCWNENYTGKRDSVRKQRPDESDVERNYKSAYDNYWENGKNNLCRSEVRIEFSKKIDDFFEKKFRIFEQAAENWYNEPSPVIYSSASDVKNAVSEYPTWEFLPDKLKWVLIDICYNAGAGDSRNDQKKIRNGLRDFKTLKAAFRGANLDLAVQECDCGPSSKRNAFKRELIIRTNLKSAFENSHLA